jgi:hypothetical protein
VTQLLVVTAIAPAILIATNMLAAYATTYCIWRWQWTGPGAFYRTVRNVAQGGEALCAVPIVLIADFVSRPRTAHQSKKTTPAQHFFEKKALRGQLQDGFQFAFRFAIGYIPLLAFAYLVPEYRDALDPDQNGCRWITLAYTILWLGTNRCAVFIFLFLPMVGPVVGLAGA